MEDLEVGSEKFIQEAANRALSNSKLGYVVIEDQIERARFSDSDNELGWEGQFNGGKYNGEKTFQMTADGQFAMMLVTNGTAAELAANPTTEEVLFSFNTLDLDSGETIAQIADLTGNGDTFGWEDVSLDNTASLDRDYNDFVVQVKGATTTAPAIEDSIYKNRDWLNTEVGQDLLSYANRPQFETGTFTVNSTGQVDFDYLYDGGWYQGELAVFSLEGMEIYEPGSLEFMTEAANRALTNSTKGRILISDTTEGAAFSDNVDWEPDYNIDAESYQGVQSIEMEPGDEVAFMLVQHTTFQEIYRYPKVTSNWGKKVLFSTDTDQIATLDNKGTIAFEDVVLSSGNSDFDYNDFVFQARGLESENTVSIDKVINPERDWRTSETGQKLLEYADRTVFNEGVFEVGETGEVTFDYLFDGGWFQGELAVFSLNGMEFFEPGSDAFIAEATRRAMTNSEEGYVLASDRTEGARFSQELDWESDFNMDAESYQGIEKFTMTPGDEFAFMLVQHATVWEITDPTKTQLWGKAPIFSVPEANPDYSEAGIVVDATGTGTYAFEDVFTDSDQDYNDVVFQIKGARGLAPSINEHINTELDWRNTEGGQDLLKYSNRASFDQGVFEVGDSGEVKIDFLYDGGYFSDGEVGIFSLKDLDIYEAGSEAFVAEVFDRVTSNTTEGYIVAKDAEEGARFSDNLAWERDYNTDSEDYRGIQTFLMNPGDAFGMVIIPGSSFEEAKTAPDWANKKQPLYSMSVANLDDNDQMAGIFKSEEGTIVGFEDVRVDLSANLDYNDFIFAIQGADGIGISLNLEDVMATNRNWLESDSGGEILDYAFTGLQDVSVDLSSNLDYNSSLSAIKEVKTIDITGLQDVSADLSSTLDDNNSLTAIKEVKTIDITDLKDVTTVDLSSNLDYNNYLSAIKQVNTIGIATDLKDVTTVDLSSNLDYNNSLSEIKEVDIIGIATA